ncbi:SCO family protein [Methylocystis iwaonis]|nr:SCO family protein [Methylocystis iwaonis]
MKMQAPELPAPARQEATMANFGIAPRLPIWVALSVSLSLVTLAGSRAAQLDTGIVRSELRFVAPEITLTDDARRPVRLDQLLAERRPVIVQFIFTSCTTICGVLTSTLAAARNELSAIGGDYQAISITIDPDYDTPERLHEFAGNFPLDDHWRLLTGRSDDIARVLATFDARFANDAKANHRAYTYLRGAPDQPWVRIEGLINCKQLVSEYRSVVENAHHLH